MITIDDKNHKKMIDKAISSSDFSALCELMKGNEYLDGYLHTSFMRACVYGNLDIIKYFITSKDFTPNQLSVRGVAEIFRCYHEQVIEWLIFDYRMQKSGAIEEVLIEMNDKNYAQHIVSLFEKRNLNDALKKDLEDKKINEKGIKNKV